MKSQEKRMHRLVFLDSRITAMTSNIL